MASACPLPATLFSVAIGSRALAGSGPTGVAGLLRRVLQRKALQSLIFSRSQQLQRLQQPSASHVHTRGRRGASRRDHARGFGGVASVASVARLKCIYNSVTYAATRAATPRPAAREGVAAPASILPAAAPRAIKYARLFNGLGRAGRLGAETGRNGVFAMRAPAPRRAARRADRVELAALDQAREGRNRPPSPVPASPLQWKDRRDQQLGANLRLTIPANRGAASPQTDPPGLRRTPPPGFRPPPSSAARFAAPAAGPAFFPAGSGENADRWEAGARGSGAPGFGAAKTAGRRSSGSGRARHG
jgi:hypothetical protein